MKKELNGRELADYIKERQARSVRGLIQQWHIHPKLAIIRTNPEQVVDSYMRIKQAYGEDIGVAVEVHTIKQSDAVDTVNKLNDDINVHGIIVQIPLPNPLDTDKILNMVKLSKDVDGLAKNTIFDAPTPLAINWLLTGYGIELKDKNLAIVGHGRLVGRPLATMWQKSGLDFQIIEKNTEDIATKLQKADVIVSAAGVPGLIKSSMIKQDAIIVDAGVSTDSNGLIGDVESSVREIPTITMTPEKGGVGPLTVAALFENVITAARYTVKK